MASPVGHYLVGLAVTESLARDPRTRAHSYWIAAAACLPDLDVVPGLLVGELGRYHHQATHSIAAGLLVAAAVVLAARWRRHRMPAGVPLLVFIAYMSHALVDGLTANPGPRPGVPLLWPWSDARYISPWPLLPHVQHTSGPVVSVHNALLGLRELALFLPLLGLVRAARACPSGHRGGPRVWVYGVVFLAVVALSIASLNVL